MEGLTLGQLDPLIVLSWLRVGFQIGKYKELTSRVSRIRVEPSHIDANMLTSNEEAKN